MLAVWLAVGAAFAARTLSRAETQRLAARLAALRRLGERGHFVMDQAFRLATQGGTPGWQIKQHSELWIDGMVAHAMQVMPGIAGSPQDRTDRRFDEYIDPYAISVTLSNKPLGFEAANHTAVLVATRNFTSQAIPEPPRVAGSGSGMGFALVSGVGNSGGQPEAFEIGILPTYLAELTPFRYYPDKSESPRAIDLGDTIEWHDKGSSGTFSAVYGKPDLRIIRCEQIPLPRSHWPGAVTRYTEWRTDGRITFPTKGTTIGKDGVVTTTTFTASFAKPDETSLRPNLLMPGLKVVDSRLGNAVTWDAGQLTNLWKAGQLDTKTLYELSKQKAAHAREGIHDRALRETTAMYASMKPGTPRMPTLREVIAGSVIGVLLVIGVIAAIKTLRGAPSP